MKKVKILIVEDHLLLARGLQLQLEELGFEVSLIVDNGNDALKASVNFRPEVVLMDIDIKGSYDGIETARRILTLHPTVIIFLTDIEDDRIYNNAKIVSNNLFLNKPVNQAQLKRLIGQALDIAAGQFPNQPAFQNSDILWIKNKSKTERFEKKDVLYFEADRAYCQIHFKDRSTIILSKNLKTVCDQVTDPIFIRVHKSYLVNENAIKFVEEDTLVLKDNKQIPIGKTYKRYVRLRLGIL